MRVKFGNKIFESDQIIYPGGTGKELYVAYSDGDGSNINPIRMNSYQVICKTEEIAKLLFNQVFKNGYVDFTRDDVDYNNFWMEKAHNNSKFNLELEISRLKKQIEKQKERDPDSKTVRIMELEIENIKKELDEI